MLIQSCCGTRSPILSFPRLGRSGAARWFSLSHRGTQGRVQPRPNLFFSSGDALPLGSSDSSSLPVSPTGGRCGSRLLRLDTGGSHSTSSPCSVAPTAGRPCLAAPSRPRLRSRHRHPPPGGLRAPRFELFALLPTSSSSCLPSLPHRTPSPCLQVSTRVQQRRWSCKPCREPDRTGSITHTP